MLVFVVFDLVLSSDVIVVSLFTVYILPVTL